MQAWHIRDETYSAALAELVNAQFRHPFAAHWAAASHRLQTASASAPAGKPIAPDTSTPSTARNRDGFSTVALRLKMKLCRSLFSVTCRF